MKQLFIIILFVFSLTSHAHDGENFTASDMLKSMSAGDKAAILMVYFGSTYDDTRALTIDPLNRKVKELYKDLEVRDAFTSRMIIRRLKERGIEKQNPVEALEKLKADGFTHIIVQSATIIEGIEMEALRRDVAGLAGAFKDIRVSNPLLYTARDYADVIKALIPADSPPLASDEAAIWVGHGTYTPATAQYAMLDYMLKAKGYNNYFVATVEGYPSLDDVMAGLEKVGAKRVILRPFMFVAGDHAKNDIAVDMKEALEAKGYQVEVLLEGLGQNESIQNIITRHLRFSFHHKMIDIIEKKKNYETSDHGHGHDHSH